MKKIQKLLIILVALAFFFPTFAMAYSNSESNEKSLGQEIFPVTDDAYVNAKNPDKNRGNITEMAIRNGGYENEWAAQPLVKFDISPIPSNSIIVSAKLYIYYFAYFDNDPSGRPLTIYSLNSDWNEETITWNSRPANNPESTSSANVPSSPGAWICWDVKDDINDFISGKEENYGWIIKDETYWSGLGIPYMYCSTKEKGDGNPPYLEVEVLEPRYAFVFGKIKNLDASGDITTFEAVKLRVMTFSPFSYNTYTSGEMVYITSKIGLLNTDFAFGFFQVAI
jgi:hypothetical protein